MMLLRAQVLALGHSGVRAGARRRRSSRCSTRACIPRIPAQGSVGASGDLAPLAHLALAMIGEGEAQRRRRPVHVPSARGARARRGSTPVVLEAKEGLALINGTQYMASLGALALLDAERLCDVGRRRGRDEPRGAQGLERARSTSACRRRARTRGRPSVARNLRALLADSEIMESHKDCGKVQDAYSLRCMPQVHGATRDALAWVRAVLEREVNSVTDNPSVFLATTAGRTSSAAATSTASRSRSRSTSRRSRPPSSRTSASGASSSS